MVLWSKRFGKLFWTQPEKQHVQILSTKAELWMSVAMQQQDQEFLSISPLLTLRLGRAEQEVKWKPIATGADHLCPLHSS